MEVTLEISCCKFPPRQELPGFWEENKQSLLALLGEAHRGTPAISSRILAREYEFFSCTREIS